MKYMFPCVSVLLVPLLTSCASHHPQPGMAEAAREDARPAGYLQVFTATETRPDGDSTFAYPHTGYTISDQDGKIVKYIRNHIGRMDGVPTVISIPAGQYRIQADAEHYGRVTFPVEIMPGHTRVVHLEEDLKHPETASQEFQLVRSPSGQIVGWREKVQ